MIASRAVAAMTAVPRPFRGILEAPPDVHELYHAHEPELSALADSLWEALQRLAVDALVRSYPHLEGRTVTREEVMTFGWRDPPPPGPD